MQGFTLPAITDAEKTKLWHKNYQSQWTVKYRSRAPGQGACSKGMSRTITMQGFTFPAITDIEKPKLLDKKSMDHEIYVKGTGSRCVLEGYVKDNYYARFHIPSYH